ncbi:ABC transporter permease [Candidatus Amarobacter glycogenicus]|uniref:ABC transporter permease n=1 Tax=Candidatus Amarobacter glycogenicus TaxID=3140699 RepID=UPI0031355E7D|nr:ABC transporter permease [Dehalococcoidia bacterium]
MSAALVIARRDLLAVVRSRSQLYSSMLTPILFLVFLGNGVSHGLEPANLPDGNFTAYLVAGAVVMTSVFSSTFSSASYYRDRDSGVLRLLLSAPVHPRVLLLGKSLAALAIGVVQAMAVLLLAAPFVDFEWQYGLVAGLFVSLAAVVLVNLMLTGLAQALASRIQTMQGFHLLMNLALFPLLFFSGAFFPIDGLPAWLRVLAFVNPLTYAVDALELAVYASGDATFIGLGVDFAVLAVLAAGTYLFGLARTPKLTYSGA